MEESWLLNSQLNYIHQIRNEFPHECCFLKSVFSRLKTARAHRLVQWCNDFSNPRLSLSFRGTIPPYRLLQFLPFINIEVNSLCISIDIPCVPMRILSTLSALNIIKNDYYKWKWLLHFWNLITCNQSLPSSGYQVKIMFHEDIL